MVAEESLQEEAALAYGLLKGAGLHPLLAYIDEGGEPRPINPEANYVPGAGLMPPVTTPYAVFVPEDEAEEARRILEDAGRDLPPPESALMNGRSTPRASRSSIPLRTK
jgi:hypothetical protein